MKRLFLVIGLVYFIAGSTFAQGRISIVAESGIDNLVQIDKDINKNTTFVKAWCVQLVATDNRTKVQNMKSNFINSYPGIRVDWDFEPPYYKLRAGAFESKLEANRLLYIIRQRYPDAYLVQSSKISPRDLL